MYLHIVIIYTTAIEYLTCHYQQRDQFTWGERIDEFTRTFSTNYDKSWLAPDRLALKD